MDQLLLGQLWFLQSSSLPQERKDPKLSYALMAKLTLASTAPNFTQKQHGSQNKKE